MQKGRYWKCIFRQDSGNAEISRLIQRHHPDVLAIENVFALAAGTEGQAFFSVDGLLVLAFALLGVGALLGTHALITPAEEAGR